MKKLFVVAAILIAGTSFAQSGVKEDIAVIQSLYGKSKQELVQTYMKLQEPQSSAFATIYEDYEIKRKELGKQRMLLIADYANSFTTLTDEKADQLAKDVLKNNMAFEKLYSKYYGKVKSAIGAINAAKFIQLENALHTAIRAETQNELPLIGEMDRSKKH
ncbi:MAG: hypothetical protein CFE25_14120 [Chitinophagaceae bacterium BSSC1]|nr:MAG: hypothetical protein CFE25_14120 [Chitinophagaceae bacterium BSSC1]